MADSPEARHISIVGDTYTVLISGRDTGGRYCLIDMLVPTGGGPPPHRHDFEEMFSIVEGEIEFTFRGHRKHPCQRTSLFQECSSKAGPIALCMFSGWPGGILSGGRQSCR